jgi:hypothetical protein
VSLPTINPKTGYTSFYSWPPSPLDVPELQPEHPRFPPGPFWRRNEPVAGCHLGVALPAKGDSWVVAGERDAWQERGCGGQGGARCAWRKRLSQVERVRTTSASDLLAISDARWRPLALGPSLCASVVGFSPVRGYLHLSRSHACWQGFVVAKSPTTEATRRGRGPSSSSHRELLAGNA